jgi:hypothetical protein
MPQAVLVGKRFPPSVIRRRIVFDPAPLEKLLRALEQARVVSFWGHVSTVRVASAREVDLTPPLGRPTLSLSTENFPSPAGEAFKECWGLSPYYTRGEQSAIVDRKHA